jgi:leucyl aminopeptidase
MGVTVEARDAPKLQADLLVVPFAEGADTIAEGLDEPIRARCAELVESGEASGEFGTTTVVHLGGDFRVQRVAVSGLGRRVDADAVRTAVATAVRAGAQVGGTLAYAVTPSLPVSREEQSAAAADGLVLGAYDQGQWRSHRRRAKEFERLVVVDGEADRARRAAQIAAWVNRARDLANAPPNELTPEHLAERAREYAEAAGGVAVEALGRDQIESLGMGSFAAVAQGSHNEPRLIVLRYDTPDARGDLTLGLVGKAVTFDTGGISLKPSLQMESMKGDMSGGAAVIAGICALAHLGVPIRAIAVVAATENMPGGRAYRPGDILRAMNGKTIEVINTDAEGRLVLADALWYAREQGATHVADFATLTGAMQLALGDIYAGMYANDDEWAGRILEAAEASGDHLCRLPLHPRYRRYVDSHFADMKNASILKQGSPALAAEFLKEFAGEGPWAHLDIAGPAFIERSRGDYLWQPGGTGYGVRLIAELGARLASQPAQAD